MNKLVKFGLVCLALLFVVPSVSSYAQTQTTSQEISSSKMSMTIDGMTCMMGCARSIEVELRNIDGVRDAVVDFNTATASVDYNSTETSESALVDFVNSYRKGAFKASLITEKNTSSSKKSCCPSKQKTSCTPEEKAKCKSSSANEASAKSCGS